VRYWLLTVLALSGTLLASEDPDDNEISPSDTQAIAREKLQRQHCLVMKALGDEIEKYTKGKITCEEFIQRFNRAAPEGTWLTGASISANHTPSPCYQRALGQRFVIEMTGAFECCQGIDRLTTGFDTEFGVPMSEDDKEVDVDGTPVVWALPRNLAFIEEFNARFDPLVVRSCQFEEQLERMRFAISIGFEILPDLSTANLSPRNATSSHSYQLWNGEESIASYADTAKLPATKTVAIGGGETIEFVLVPAGEFLMGTPPAPSMEVEDCENEMLVGGTLAVFSALFLAVQLFMLLGQVLLKRQRPTYSLLRWLAIVVIAGLGVVGAQHWWYSAQKVEKYQAERPKAVGRFAGSTERERPAHKVTITVPFYMSKYPITQEQYFQVTGLGVSQVKGRNLPADWISWNAAQNFCQELQKHGHVRLPTEAEWEFACRAGTSSAYYTGDDEADLARAGWYFANSVGSTHPVGTRAPNAFGLHDMHGNVRQWCEDVMSPYPDHAVFDPRNPGEGEHVLRGGSWYSAPERCRSAYRSYCNAIGQYDVVGFRVVMDVE
jgi:formylglycine-generating enzyme required for sulfatase activity